ncbi:hypothetical protein HDE_10919 [Halotydeus destructor]|nr:hypothetical protein HDE_10919 [Halotydeus destructor]
MMKHLLCSALFAAAIFVVIEGQAYSYNVTVVLGQTKFDVHDGKLKAVFMGGNGKYDNKVALSTKTESFSAGLVKSYLVAALYPIEYIEKVALEFESKDFHVFTTHKIYVDKVTIDPAYLATIQRQQSVRGFCAAVRPQKLKEDKEIQFWIKC